MRKQITTRVGLAAALLLGLGLAINGCAIDKPVEPDLSLGTLDASSFVTLGNSLTAGMVSGGLGGETQANSFPALLAGQMGVADFQQPTITEPGLPAKLAVTLVAGNPYISEMAGLGTPTNTALARAYNNLAVPGAGTLDILLDDGSTGTIGPVILRGLGTQLEQAARRTAMAHPFDRSVARLLQIYEEVAETRGGKHILAIPNRSGRTSPARRAA